MLYLVKGDREEAVLCIENMSKYAIAFDSLPESDLYDSVLLNTIEYKNEKPEGAAVISLCAKLLRGRFANRIWAPIRNDERFIEAIHSMEQYAR
jgi:hypothetical protein